VYNKPLLDIVGVTQNNKTLPLGLCVMAGEKEEHFLWVLRSLKSMLIENDCGKPRLILIDRDQALLKALPQVYPDIPAQICQGHFMKAVVAKIKSCSTQLGLGTWHPSINMDRFHHFFRR